VCPPLLKLPGEDEYRAHYRTVYVNGGPVVTFDGMEVSFFPEQFAHSFYRDSTPTAKDKAHFDRERAERMDWIGAVLRDSAAEVYRREMDNSRRHRIALWLHERYAVIVQIRRNRPNSARFITAYVVDSNRALAKMRGNPRW
jgi:hypothetical protein